VSALGDEIRATIAHEGPITVERFMELALGHPDHGYYMTRDPFGAAGDFTTAPEISQMYGELLGLWAAEVWTLMGRPNPVRLIELGPGRGTLMSDALRAARIVPDFRAALDVTLIEMSPTLANIQYEALLTCGAPVAWAANLSEAPDGPAIILANEFLDALPVRQFVRRGGRWRERMVRLDEAGRLTFGLANEPEAFLKVEADEGAVLEVSAAGHRFMFELGARLVKQGGAALFVDYGHGATGFGETLQALRAHRYVDPLVEPGEADLTAHVDFAAMARSARASGAAVHGPIDQGDFLRALGIDMRTQALAERAPDRAEEFESARRRLVGKNEGEMGGLFKAMVVANRSLSAPPGFQPYSAKRA
jgi:SAM-dependent MidA family methyltransferase